MKKLIVTFIVIAIAATAFAGCSAPTSTQTQPTPAATLKPVSFVGKIIAEGKVVPVKSASLSMAVSGIVAEVPVKEGDRVDAGALLVRLSAGQQKAAVAQSEAALKRAQAARQKVDQTVDENQITAARADLANADAAVRVAQTAYDRAGGASNPQVGMLPTTLDLERATNARNAAQARLNTLLKPPAAADLAAADAGIAAAQADLDRAKAVLADTELRAPFAGTIVTVDAKVGEQVSPAAPIVQLADLGLWEIQTTDLTEINIVKVREGDTVTMTFDAIPGLELAGKVTRIDSLGQNRQGDIVYTVTVKPDQMDDRLRWNMTAKVSIEPKQ
jgi:multidrug resistance efflux pump